MTQTFHMTRSMRIGSTFSSEGLRDAPSVTCIFAPLFRDTMNWSR